MATFYKDGDRNMQLAKYDKKMAVLENAWYKSATDPDADTEETVKAQYAMVKHAFSANRDYLDMRLEGKTADTIDRMELGALFLEVQEAYSSRIEEAQQAIADRAAASVTAQIEEVNAQLMETIDLANAKKESRQGFRKVK